MAGREAEVYSCQGCKYEDTDEMVQCNNCNAWYHYTCAGSNINDDIANYPWNCERCVIDQFALTLENNRPKVPTLQNVNETSVKITQNVDEVSELSATFGESQNSVLKYIEAKQRLEEEQMNKSFELQRKFLRERFGILNLNKSEEQSLTDVSEKEESINVWLKKQVDNSKQVHFDTIDSVRMGAMTQRAQAGTSTPFRTPSTVFETTKTQRICERGPQVSTFQFQNKEDSAHSVNTSQSTNFQRQPVETQQRESLFVPVSTSKNDGQLNVPLEFKTGTKLRDDSTQRNKPSVSWNSKFDNLIRPQQTTSSINPFDLRSNVRTLKPQQTNETSLDPGLNTSQIAARHVLPRDLPKFSGSPREWPMFISSFESSTETGGYTNAENLIRLQRSLQGNALEAVRSILLTPENVPNAIETLRMMFVRPDLIIFSLIQTIRDEPPPKLEKLETIINFALVVRNLSSIIQVTRLESHMNNPYLMQEIVDKLPSTLRLDWSRFKRTLPNATMVTLGQWLYEVAEAASDVVTPNVPQKDKGKNFNKNEQVKPKPDRFYVAKHSDTSSTAVPQKCKICLQNCIKVSNCKKFQGLSVDQRWNEIKEKKLCSTCLKVHRRFQCKDKKKCKEGCEAWHHIMLHKEPAKTSAVHYNLSFSHTVIYRIIPVMLYGPTSSVLTYAYLDGGSGITLLEGSLAESLGLEGDNIGLNLKWTSKIQRSEPDSKRVGLQISDVFGTEKYDMNNVRTVRNLELPEQTLTKDLLHHYSYLKDIPIQTYEKAVSRILIGLENINLIVSLQTVEGNWQEPVATRTHLGWVLQGGPQYYSKKPIYCLPMREQQVDSDLHQLVKNFFSIESFGVKIPERIIESKQAERAREIMESTTIIEKGRCESGLLWKSDEVKFPDNKAMAMKRLESLERRMMKDEKLVRNMNEHLADYQLKNYTRKLSQQELETSVGPVWYLLKIPA